MKLAIQKRKTETKGETNQLRREGQIPGILYGHEGANTSIQLKEEEFQAVLRQLRPGLLATTVFELHDGSKTLKAIVKDVQYHVADYRVLHIDFALLKDDQPVTVNVPIQLMGAADCAGVKLGGFLRQAIRTLKVSCLPKHIPQELVVDVREMVIGQSKRLADIAIPADVRPLAKMNEVAITVRKKAGT